MLRSDLCNYSDTQIVVKEEITVEGTKDANKKNLTFKNNASFRSCTLKINNLFVHNVEYLDIVKLMYNLLEHSDSYSMTSGSLWNYYRDEVIDAAKENVGDYRENSKKTIANKYFEYKAKIIGRKPANNNTLYRDVVVPLKYLSNFWRSLD